MQIGKQTEEGLLSNYWQSLSKSCFPWANALCLIRLLGSGGHLMDRRSFLTAQHVCSRGISGYSIVSNIANRCALSHAPAGIDGFRQPRSDKEWSHDVCVVLVCPFIYLYFRTMIRFDGEMLQISTRRASVPAGLAAASRQPTSLANF